MEEIQLSIKNYFKEWRDWYVEAKGYAFDGLRPMHIGWKVNDETSVGQKVTELLPFTEQGHIGTVDNRKIVLLALKDPVEDVPILQVMQLRPGSSDPLGLDHVAFYCIDMKTLQEFLGSSAYKWEIQSNSGHSWVSLWFGDNKLEAKFFDHTSLDLGAHELSEASLLIKSQ